jgi:hypothetical protein
MRPRALYLHGRPPFGWQRHRPNAPTAYHEAGHVLLAYGTLRRVVTASAVPSGDTAGLVRVAAALPSTSAPCATPPEPPRPGVLAFGWLMVAAGLLGGERAEFLATGSASGHEADYEQANAALDAAADIFKLPAGWWTDRLHAAVDVYLRERWPLVEAVAAALLDSGEVAGDTIAELVGADPERLDLGETLEHIAALAGVRVPR